RFLPYCFSSSPICFFAFVDRLPTAAPTLPATIPPVCFIFSIRLPMAFLASLYRDGIAALTFFAASVVALRTAGATIFRLTLAFIRSSVSNSSLAPFTCPSTTPLSASESRHIRWSGRYSLRLEFHTSAHHGSASLQVLLMRLILNTELSKRDSRLR